MSCCRSSQLRAAGAIFILSLLAAVSGAELETIVNSENLLPNASFEKWEGDHPSGWQLARWSGEAQALLGEIGHTGERSIFLESEKGADISLWVEVDVKPYSTYRLSAWVKTESLETGSGLGAFVALRDQPMKTEPLTGTEDWTEVAVEFDTGANDNINVNLVFGGWGQSKGRAWFDDARLELVATKGLKPRVTIDASATREPLSKYIYGQFIEHLGRCIYGGIWAEMIEDRKFYHAVGAEKSPWRTVGEDAVVDMVTDGSYVGAQTPVIRLKGDGSPCGLIQTGLGVLAGKGYVGRIVLAGDEEAAPVEVRLVWGDGPGDRDTTTIQSLSEGFAKHPLRFTAGKDTDEGRLEIVSSGKGTFRVGTVSLMPADNVHGMRGDTLALLKELDSPIYRWPGGNFVSGYDWRDGIGDPDKRPPRWERAWDALEPNDFGIDEFMLFCRELGTEPLVVVNSGMGDAKIATQEVEYCNGAASTPMGSLRAANGHPECYNVKWWGIGNEMYGDWQLGHIPLEDYIRRHNEFAAAMRAVDPAIKLIGVGADGDWSEQMLTHCAETMDMISEHFYSASRKGLISHVDSIAADIRHKVKWHREARQRIAVLAGKDIRIAMDEWNYGWWDRQAYDTFGMVYTLRDALGIAKGLNEYSRSTDIIAMANLAQTVNVIAPIKTTKTAAAFDTIAYPLILYRREFGTIPVEVSGSPEPLDVAAAWTEDRKALTVAVVNPTQDDYDLAFDLRARGLTGNGRAWRITGPDPMATNDLGKEAKVRMDETPVSGIADRLAAPRLSVTLYRLEVGQ